MQKECTGDSIQFSNLRTSSQALHPELYRDSVYHLAIAIQDQFVNKSQELLVVRSGIPYIRSLASESCRVKGMSSNHLENYWLLLAKKSDIQIKIDLVLNVPKPAMKIHLLIIAILFSVSLFSQDNFPPPVRINSITQYPLKLENRFWQFLSDNNGQYTYPGILSKSAVAGFREFSASERLSSVLKIFWVRFSIQNEMSEPARLCLENIIGADKTDYFIDSGEYNHSHLATGNLLEWGKKDGLRRINVIPITIGPGVQLQIYARVQNSYYYSYPGYLTISIDNKDRVVETNYIENDKIFPRSRYFTLFIGLILFASIFGLSFFLFTRDMVFLYYALFLVYFDFEGITESVLDTLLASYPRIILLTYALAKSTGVFLMAQFVRHFLKTYVYYPRWDRFLKIAAITQMVSYILRFLLAPHLSWQANYTALYIYETYFDISVILMACTLLFFVKKQDKYIRILFISTLPSFLFWSIGFALTTFYNYRFQTYSIPYPPFMNWLLYWFDLINSYCVLWFSISFLWILIIQFLHLRKQTVEQQLEKEKLLREQEAERMQMITAQKENLEKEVQDRTALLRLSLENLKSTQMQLIQAEKMASLGQLTAGIAHEIQNPLNFVNNFSEVTREMIQELKSEKKELKKDEQDEILNDIDANLEKISHHGKRADAIVKGMLEHSRQGTGERVLTDINSLADEYLKLAYHGVRTRDKSFVAELVTDYGENIVQLDIVQQDIGRVLLNVYNNAFYAVKAKQLAFTNKENYQPAVKVSTMRISDQVEIKISDNGTGIPGNNLTKIFQPFFTTKPTGQGTGLGLSLAYDIVKAHGGEIKVNSKEGEGSEFVILLPVS